jgi:predicted CopG family antitoxin
MRHKNLSIELNVYNKLLEKKSKIIADTGRTKSFSDIIGGLLQ